jgi:hypothetical protein
MNIHWARACLLLVALCIASSALMPNAAWCDDPPKDSIASLFDGIPADLRSNVRLNSVRRDRVNDWLADHVDGKGKTVELQLPVRVAAIRSKDRTYTVAYTVGILGKGKAKGPAFGPGAGGAGGQFPGSGNAGGKGKGKEPAAEPGAGAGGAGAQFPGFYGGPDFKVSVLGDDWSIDLKLGANDPEKFWPNQFERSGVSVADAEKLVELKKVTVKAKVQEVKLVSSFALRLTLADIELDGKKMTPRKREPAKVPQQ